MTAEAAGESRGAGPGGEAAVPARGDLLDGLVMSWSGEVPLDDLLAAARRQLRQRAGEDVPAWEEPAAQQPDAQQPAAEQSDFQLPAGPHAQRSARYSHAPDREGPRNPWWPETRQPGIAGGGLEYAGPDRAGDPTYTGPGLHQPETWDLFTFQDPLAQNLFREEILGPGDAARRHEAPRQ
jgi:hypothetical protein